MPTLSIFGSFSSGYAAARISSQSRQIAAGGRDRIADGDDLIARLQFELLRQLLRRRSENRQHGGNRINLPRVAVGAERRRRQAFLVFQIRLGGAVQAKRTATGFVTASLLTTTVAPSMSALAGWNLPSEPATANSVSGLPSRDFNPPPM